MDNTARPGEPCACAAELKARLAVVEHRLADFDRLVSEKFTALDRALELARRLMDERLRTATGLMDERLRTLNELRTDVERDRAQFVTRQVHEAEIEARDIRISALENWRSKVVGGGTALVLLAGVLGGAVAKLFGG